MTHLTNKLQSCANSHRGGTRALNPKLCGSDWCSRCSKERTSMIVQATKDKFLGSNSRLYHDTALIGPVISPTQARTLAFNLLHKMAKADVECVGSLEYGDPKDTKGFQKFFTAKPFYKSIHFSIAHLHFISNKFYKKDEHVMKDFLFNYNHQLYQQIEQKGKYENQSRPEFIETVIEYGRKRSRIQTKQWFNSVKDSDQQLSFKVEYGVVSEWNHALNDWVIVEEDEGQFSNVCEGGNRVERVNEGWKNRSESLDNLEVRMRKSDWNIGSVMYIERNEETDQKNTQKTIKKNDETVKKIVVINELFQIEEIKKVKKEKDNNTMARRGYQLAADQKKKIKKIKKTNQKRKMI